MGNRLNILLLSRYFHPEIGTAANLFYELAKGLIHNGHKVTVVTNFPWYNLEIIPLWDIWQKDSICNEYSRFTSTVLYRSRDIKE